MKTNGLLLLVILISLSCSAPQKKDPKVTIAVAANMQFAMQSLIAKFEDIHSIHVEISSGSSGVLTTQIRQGAPFDIFLSADLSHPQKLFSEGFALNPPETYGQGKLILWSNSENKFEVFDLSLLEQPRIKRVAIANPEIAPYGYMGKTALIGAGLYDKIQSKLIIGENISQVNQYIQSENVDIGITSKSVISSPSIRQRGQWIEIPDSLYDPIDQGIVLLRHGKDQNLNNAQLFYNFMFSEQAKNILRQNGYDIKQ